MPQRSSSRAVRPHRADAAAVVFSSILTVVAVQPAAALKLDFSDALQSLRNGTPVETVRLHGATLRVAVEHHSSHVAIVFDSEHPKHYPQLGTPNEDFDGPGEGNGGERGEAGENKSDLGKVVVIAEDEAEIDADDAGHSAPELEDGVIRLSFSHPGYLTFKLINVDDDETHVVAYRDHDVVGELEARNLGKNSVQKIDLTRFGSVDRVEIDMDGVAAIAAIKLDVPVTGTEASTWTQVKKTYR